MSASATESRFSFLALLMALFMFGYVVRVADRLTVRAPALAVPAASQDPALLLPPAAQDPAAQNPAAQDPATPADSSPAGAPSAGGGAAAGSRPGRPYLAPRCAALCKVAMGITMGYMLITML